MALQVTCAGVVVPVAIDSITCGEKIDDTSTSTAFTVIDSTGLSLSQYQIVQVTDTSTSTLLYAGYIDNVSDTPFGPGNTSTRIRVVTCKDSRWCADKLTWVGPEFDGWMAGDVAAELHRVALAAEGVTASYALDHDHDASSWGAGTLAGTQVVNGALTLSAAGTDFTQTETSTSDFNAGTLTNAAGVNGSLALTSYQAIKYSGSAGANLQNNNLYAYRKIWAGSYTLASLDQIYIDTWIASSSPQIMASIDMQFSDGTWMHDSPTEFQDQWTISMTATQDLAGWATDQWMQRVCIVPSTKAGKVVVAIYLCLNGQNGGDYTAYFKNIKITNSGGTTQVSAFAGADTAMHANVPSGSSGYFNLKAGVVTVYAHDGSRVSPARSISAVGVVKGSVISWVERDAPQPTTGKSMNYAPQVQVLASYDDGATWQACINHQPLPGLPVGMNTSGRTITLWQQLAVGGPSPELAPLFDSCSFTVYSAAACTKTDYVDIDNTQTLLGLGTLTNCTSYTDGVKTTGWYKNWDDLTPGTIFMLGLGVSPAYGVQMGFFYNRGDANNEIRARLDDAGTWQNFIAEVDVQIVTSTGQYGLEYRTNSFVSGGHRFAYCVQLSGTQLILVVGSNGGADTHTNLATVALNLTVGAWYRLKVAVNGSNHKVFLNDVQFINFTDATYGAFGNFCLWAWDNAAGRFSGHYDNFGVVSYESDFISVSTKTTAALSLGGIVGSSVLNWEASVPSSSQLVVESTLDNGATWATCTNGGVIPLLVPGYNAAGKSLKVRFSMTNQAVGQPIAITGYSVFVVGQYSASGTRVSPVLNLDNAGTVGSSSVTWTAIAPAGTGAAVASSTDNITYTPVAVSGNAITGLVAQGVMNFDDFQVNSAGNYSGNYWGAGPSPSFVVDTANSRLRITGTTGILLWTTFTPTTTKDVNIELISDQCDQGGMLWRYADINNLYYLQLRDASSGSNPNTVAVRKRVASVDSQILAPTAVSFSRGTYHTLKVTMIGTTITVFFDGLQVASFTDASLASAGKVGLYQNSATESHWYSLRAQQLGQSAAGAKAYTKTTLTATDPAQNPLMSELVTSVRGPDLMTGVMINDTKYQYKNTVAACASDVAAQSKYYWRIDKNKHYSMKDRSYSPAPWPLYSADPLLMINSSYPQAIRQSPLYRNRQYVYNCIDLQTITEQKIGNGAVQSWALAYPVDSIISLTMDAAPQTFGIQGVDTGRAFYSQLGKNVLSTDASLYPESGAVIAVTYIAQVPYVAMKENTAQQAIIATIDSTSGIISASTDGAGISKAAGDVLAQADIDAYANLSVDWEFFTQRPGLSAGHYISVFVPEYGLFDLDMLITDIVTTLWLDGTGTLRYFYDVKATSGANIGAWQKIFA